MTNDEEYAWLADLDGDGLLDLVSANRRGRDLSVLRARADGGFHPARSFPVAASPRALATADLDADGHVDVADVMALLDAWGTLNAPEFDLDADGEVGARDLTILLAELR